jgi:hypothetical protein
MDEQKVIVWAKASASARFGMGAAGGVSEAEAIQTTGEVSSYTPGNPTICGRVEEMTTGETT